MGVLDRIFRPTLARARREAAAGHVEEAVRLFVEAGAVDEAERAAVAALDRKVALDDRVAFLRVVLRAFPVGGGGAALASELGRTLALLGEEPSRSRAERRLLLLEAAACLDRAGLAVESAEAYLAADARDEASRVLEAAGEVERLEALLGAASIENAKARALRSAVSSYEDALATGARREALAALGAAAAADPGDVPLVAAREELARRTLREGRVRLSVAGRLLLLLETSEVVLGREGDVSLRGASLSRRHASIEGLPGGVRVRDLGSRNGTHVSGVPIGGVLELMGPSRVGLGEDVAVCVTPEARGFSMEVVEGPDRGLRIEAGRGEFDLGVGGARLVFDGGWAVLRPDAEGVGLGGRTIHAPIELLVGDRLEIGGVTVEVVP
ncbi:MAG: FHA domain-containing protein [Polyangiales bacterium]